MKNNLLYYLSMITISLFLLMVVYVLYLLYYPFKVVEYSVTPLPISKTKVYAGEQVQLRNVFCKYMDLPLKRFSSIENDIIINLPLVESKTAPGCYDRNGSYLIPSFLEPGERGRIHLALEYRVNPLRTITYHLYSEEFEVIEATPSGEIKK